MDINPILDFFKANPDSLGYEPETIIVQIGHDLKDADVPEEELVNLIMGVRACILSNSPWNYVTVFGNIVDVFSLNSLDIEHISKPSMREIYLTIKEMQKIRPEEEFSEDIILYAGLAASNEGVLYVPDMDRINKFLISSDPNLQGKIRDLYESLNGKSIKTYQFEETPLQVGFLKSRSLTD